MSEPTASDRPYSVFHKNSLLHLPPLLWRLPTRLRKPPPPRPPTRRSASGPNRQRRAAPELLRLALSISTRPLRLPAPLRRRRRQSPPPRAAKPRNASWTMALPCWLLLPGPRPRRPPPFSAVRLCCMRRPLAPPPPPLGGCLLSDPRTRTHSRRSYPASCIPTSRPCPPREEERPPRLLRQRRWWWKPSSRRCMPSLGKRWWIALSRGPGGRLRSPVRPPRAQQLRAWRPTHEPRRLVTTRTRGNVGRAAVPLKRQVRTPVPLLGHHRVSRRETGGRCLPPRRRRRSNMVRSSSSRRLLPPGPFRRPVSNSSSVHRPSTRRRKCLRPLWMRGFLPRLRHHRHQRHRRRPHLPRRKRSTTASRRSRPAPATATATKMQQLRPCRRVGVVGVA